MSDLIDRQQAIEALAKHEKSKGHNYTLFVDIVSECAEIIRDLPSAEPKTEERMPKTEQNVSEADVIFRKDAIEAMSELLKRVFPKHRQIAEKCLNALPSAEPEQRYTEEELRVFKHGISLSLLSKRSSQYWQYDEDTATEIKFLERLYEKIGADMRGEKDGTD